MRIGSGRGWFRLAALLSISFAMAAGCGLEDPELEGGLLLEADEQVLPLDAEREALPAADPDFALSASPSSREVRPPSIRDATYNLTITPLNGFSAWVSLSVSGLPAATTAVFSSNPTDSNSTLTVRVGQSGTPAGTYRLTITGTGDGISHSVQVTLVVQPASGYVITGIPSSRTINAGETTTFTISSTKAGTALLSVSGLPAGATGSFSPQYRLPATLTIATSATQTPPGSYALLIRSYLWGYNIQTTTVRLEVVANQPDFSLSVDPYEREIGAGENAVYTVTVVPKNGFDGPVTLSTSGLPSSIAASFLPNPTATSSVLTLRTLSSEPANNFYFEINGTGDGLARSVDAHLYIRVEPVPDFELAVSPSSQTIAAGGSTTYSVSITASGGFAEPVTLSASGLPAGATASFSPNPATSASTMTVTTASATAAGAWLIEVSAIGGGISRSDQVELRVSAASVIANGGFESGDLSGWTVSSLNAPVISTVSRSGAYSAQVGSAQPAANESTISQTFTVPPTGGTLSFWFNPHCSGSIATQWLELSLRRPNGTVLVAQRDCSNSGVWTPVSVDLRPWAGQQLVLWLKAHDDNSAFYPTWGYLDDVQVR